MDDLRLWNDLATRSADDPILGQQILEFETDRADGKKKADRWVFISDFIRVLPHQSDEVQTAILQLLTGMSGQPAIKAIVDCIKKPAATPVVAAAAESLVKNGQSFEWQLVHAFFSKDKETRQVARSLVDSPITAAMGLHLLVDDDIRPELLPKLYGLKLPIESIDMIFHLWKSNVVSLQKAQWLMYGIVHSAIINGIEHDVVKLGIPMQLLDALFEAGDFPAPNVENLAPRANWLMELLFNPDLNEPLPALGVDVSHHWLEDSYAAYFGRKSHMPALVLAMLIWLRRLPEQPQRVVNLAMYLDLRVTNLEWIPKSKRREALIALYGKPFHKDHLQADIALELLQGSPIVRRESGQLDLAVIGSLVRCIAAPTETFESLFSKEQVVAAFLESPEDSIVFFEAPLSTKYICHVLEILWRQGNGKKNRIRTCAMLALNLPGSRLGILDDLEAEQWSSLLAETLRIVDGSTSNYPEKRLSLLAKQLSFQLKENFVPTIETILALKHPHKNQLAVEVFIELTREIPVATIVPLASALADPDLESFLMLVDHAAGVPFAIERQLVDKLSKSKNSFAASWAEERLKSLGPNPAPAKPVATETEQLTSAEADEIANCPENELTAKIAPALRSPSHGLVAALQRRPSPAKANSTVVSALVGCHDNVRDVDVQASLYCGNSPKASSKVKDAVKRHWKNNSGLTLLGNAFNYLWEYHLFLIDASIERLSELTELAHELKTPVFAEVLWSAASRLANVQAARNKQRYYELISPTLFESCVLELRGANGEVAAAILVRAFLTRDSDVEHLRNEVIELVPLLPEKVRNALSRWVSVEGLTSANRIERGRAAAKIKGSLHARIENSNNLADLKRWCADSNWKVVDSATSRLLELGAQGVEALLEVLVAEPLPPRFDIVAETIPFFDPLLQETTDALEFLRGLAIDSDSSPFRKFMLSSQLLQTDSLQGNPELIDSLVAAVKEGGDLQWFISHDWNTSIGAIKSKMDELDFAIQASTSNQSQAYLKAINLLTSGRSLSSEHVTAVEDFLRCGSRRAYDTRSAAAEWLRIEESKIGLPLVAANLVNEYSAISQASFDEVERITQSAVASGCRATENAIIQSLPKALHLTEEQKTKILEWLVANACHVSTSDAAVPLLNAEGVDSKLNQVARTFKWGIDQGLELLGQKFRVSMLTDSDLGYTRLHENKVFVNILPIMEGKQNGQKVVEGLILHELGHHIYHKGKSNQKIWKKAQREGLHGLLNIVSDEHLERNLRTKDRSYDSRLKQLSSFAFQHNSKDFGVGNLLQLLNVRSLEVLSEIKLGVTDTPFRVRVDSGQLLRQLETSGSSFSRFFRALRMGLGNRFDDPKVAEALKLFDRSFRNSNMRKLYEITLKLKEIFQHDTGFTNFISQDSLIFPNELERARAGRGLTDDLIEREIQRITSREELERSRASGGGTGGRAINVIDEIEFDRISNVLKAPRNREAERELAQTVVGPAKMLRAYLSDLGEKYVQQRRRLNGYRLDRQAVNRLVTRQDPRIMISRRREFRNDLFIGVAIDCSGSMTYYDNMGLAKRFAALLAEATRDVDGIDLKLIGFTHNTIFDVGDNHCNSIHTLHAGGGNNDAAGLWHIAQEALRSKRKSRLLVMISDGLPTECSVESLRTLVQNLTQKFGICCAQLAVEELEEVCFPNYVLVKSSSEAAAIRKFGATIAKLIRKTISG